MNCFYCIHPIEVLDIFNTYNTYILNRLIDKVRLYRLFI